MIAMAWQALIISTRLAALLHSVRLLLSHVTRNLVSCFTLAHCKRKHLNTTQSPLKL